MSGFQKQFVNEIRRLARSEATALVKDLQKKVSSLAKRVRMMEAASSGRPVSVVDDTDVALDADAKALADGYRKGSLKELAKKNALTQRQLAALLGASLVSISKWLSGKSEPRARAKARIMELFALDRKELFARLPEDVRENRKSRRKAAEHAKKMQQAAKARAKAATVQGGAKRVRKVKVAKPQTEASISATAAQAAVDALMNAPISE